MAASIPETDRPRDAEITSPRWSHSAEDLRVRVSELLDEAHAVKEAVIAASNATEAVGLLDRLEGLLDQPRALVALYARVHPHEKVRLAAREGHQAFVGFLTALLRDPEVERAMTGEVSPGHGELRELLQAGMRGAGAGCLPVERERLASLQQTVLRLNGIYRRILAASVPTLILDEAVSLAGMDAAWCDANVALVDGQRAVRLSGGLATELLSRCDSEATRRRCWELLGERGWPDNRPVIEQLLEARQAMAACLGHGSWAAWECSRTTAGCPEVVRRFVRRVEAGARSSMDQETEQLLESDGGRMAPWNRLFLRRQRLASSSPPELATAPEAVAALRGVLAQAMGWRIEVAREVSVWARGVEAWDVWDEEGAVGRVYLDLYARGGKVLEPCTMRVRTGVAGGLSPEAALLASLDPAAPVTHAMVIALCHELGHVVHHLLASESRWIGLNGIPAGRDVAELAAQVFEAWAWEPEVLRRLGWSDAEMERLAVQERASRGTRTMRQLLYATYSLDMHAESSPDLDLERFDADVFERFGDGEAFAEHLYAHFPHVIAYGATYFAYEWARAVARDVLDQLEGSACAAGALDAFGSAVLRPGRAVKPARALERLLGRPWSVQAYVRWLEGA